MHCMGIPASDTQSHLHSHHSLDSVVEVVGTATSATVSNVVGMIGTEAGLGVQTAWCASPTNILPTGCQLFPVSALFLLASNQRDKADAPFIREAHIYLLGVQCLVSLPDGLAGCAFPFYRTLPVQKPPARAPGPLDPTITLPEGRDRDSPC